MKPILFDTSIWIEWLRGSKKAEALSEITSGRVMFFSSVVMLELYSGAYDKRAVHVIESLLNPFLKNRRMLVPTEKDYVVAGKLLAELKRSSSNLANDALIAVSARKIGAQIYSLNERDFTPLCESLGVSFQKV